MSFILAADFDYLYSPACYDVSGFTNIIQKFEFSFDSFSVYSSQHIARSPKRFVSGGGCWLCRLTSHGLGCCYDDEGFLISYLVDL